MGVWLHPASGEGGDLKNSAQRERLEDGGEGHEIAATVMAARSSKAPHEAVCIYEALYVQQ